MTRAQLKRIEKEGVYLNTTKNEFGEVCDTIMWYDAFADLTRIYAVYYVDYGKGYVGERVETLAVFSGLDLKGNYRIDYIEEDEDEDSSR